MAALPLRARRTLLVLLAATATACLPAAPAFAASAFSFGCKYSHSLADDPIVAPDVPGGTHIHDFFGNRGTSAFTTLTNIRTYASNCSVHGDASADRSAYWAPSLLQHLADGGVRRITPGSVTIYYHGDTVPADKVRSVPTGLRMISSRGTWSCGHGWLADGPDHPYCVDDPNDPYPVVLTLRMTFQRCWDGVGLDSVDHRSHVAHPGPRGSDDCPATHPVRIPQIRMFARYPTAGGPDYTQNPTAPGATSLTSGGHATVHADFFDGWDPIKLESLVQRCLRHTRPTCDPA